MYGILINLRILVVAVVLAFVMGWVVNGWRLNTKIEKLIATYTQASLKAETKARNAEQSINTAVQNARSESDAKNKQVRANLEHTISQLRNRPERPQVPQAAGVAVANCTGTELFRQDAEFLSREAARADELETALRQCEATYNAARKELNKD